MFEKDLPGRKTAEFNKDSEIGELPLETCETINGSWGFNVTRPEATSRTRELIRYLVRAAGIERQLPAERRPDARRHDPARVRRAAAARSASGWRSNGEAIYGTRGGPVAPRSPGA